MEDSVIDSVEDLGERCASVCCSAGIQEPKMGAARGLPSGAPASQGLGNIDIP